MKYEYIMTRAYDGGIDGSGMFFRPEFKPTEPRGAGWELHNTTASIASNGVSVAIYWAWRRPLSEEDTTVEKVDISVSKSDDDGFAP